MQSRCRVEGNLPQFEPPVGGAVDIAVQMSKVLRSRRLELLGVSLAEEDAVTADKVQFNRRQFGRLIRHDGIKECHDGLARRQKRHRDTQRLGVIEELLQDIGSGQNCEMMVKPPRRWCLVGSLGIPMAAHLPPNLSVLDIVVFYRHPVTTKVSKTLDPSFFKGGDRFVQHRHHAVCQVDER